MDIFEKEEYLKNVVKTSVEYVNEDLKSFYEKEIKIDLVIIGKNNNINAWADRNKEGTYVIGIYWACYHWLDDFWKKMLTNSQFLSILGLNEYTEEMAEKYYPLMLCLSLKCIVFHELGHIFNGHVDYIKIKDGDDIKLYEFVDINQTKSENLGNIDPIVWQSMEWNADDFAATRIVGQSTYKDMINKSVINNPEHGLWLTIVSQVVVYSLMYMGAENRVSSDYKKSRHLPLRFRLESIIRTMLVAYEGFNRKISSEIPFEIYMQVAIRIEEWVNLFMFNQYNPKVNISIQNNQNDLDSSHREYYYEVEKYYLNKLELELKDYSYMKIVSTKA